MSGSTRLPEFVTRSLVGSMPSSRSRSAWATTNLSSCLERGPHCCVPETTTRSALLVSKKASGRPWNHFGPSQPWPIRAEPTTRLPALTNDPSAECLKSNRDTPVPAKLYAKPQMDRKTKEIVNDRRRLASTSVPPGRSKEQVDQFYADKRHDYPPGAIDEHIAPQDRRRAHRPPLHSP